MLRYALFLSMFWSCVFVVTAQAVISHKIDFSDEKQSHTLLTDKNIQYLGRILSIENDQITFKDKDGDVLEFSIKEILYVGPLDDLSLLTAPAGSGKNQKVYVGRRSAVPLPSNQLLYSATALPYESRGAYRNTMLLANQIDFNLNEYLEVGGGVLIPALVMGRAHAKISITDFIHWGLATQYHRVFFDDQRIIHPYTMLTIGKRDRFLNFTYGYWINRRRSFGGNNLIQEIQPMVTFAGSFTFSETWRFYAEAAAVLGPYENFLLPSFNFSNHRRRNTFEFGIMALPDSTFPILPILSYNYVF